MYQPKKGSLAARLIEVLSSAGGSVKTADLAREAGVKRGEVAANLGTALRAGVVVRTGLGVYALGVGKGGGAAKPKRSRPASRLVESPAVEPRSFTVGVFSDGDVTLVNPAEIGESYVRLTREQAVTLLHFLTGRDVASLPSSASPALPRD